MFFSVQKLHIFFAVVTSTTVAVEIWTATLPLGFSNCCQKKLIAEIAVFFMGRIWGNFCNTELFTIVAEKG